MQRQHAYHVMVPQATMPMDQRLDQRVEWTILPAKSDFFFDNDGHTALLCHLIAAESGSLTIPVYGTIEGKSFDPRIVPVLATDDPLIIGPFPPRIYNTPQGTVSVFCSTPATQPDATWAVAVVRLEKVIE